MTEREMLAALDRSFTGRYKGREAPERYARAWHVRSRLGRRRAGASGLGREKVRTIDFVAMDTWKEMAFHAVEVKVSRADLQRELRDPSKAEAIIEETDYFYVAVSDSAHLGGLAIPETWGVLYMTQQGEIKCSRKATRTSARALTLPPVSRAWVASFSRALAARARG